MTHSRASFVAACLGAFVVYLDVSVVNVATTAIGRDLGGDLVTLEWVVNGYTLSFGALLLTGGTLSDTTGARRMFRLGMVVFTLSSLGCALAPAQPILILSRIAQGVGGALAVPATLSVVRAAFPDEHARARAVGLWAALGGSLALAVGPVVGGVLVEHLGWRAIFLVNVPLGGTALTLARTGSGTPEGVARRRLDLPGQALAVAGLAALTAGLVEAGTLGWSATPVVGCLATFALSLVAFLLVERRSAAPMLPPNLFRRTGFSAATAAGTLVNFAFYGLIFALSLFFQHAWALSPATTGLAFLPLTASLGVSNLASARLSTRRDTRTVIVAGCAAAIMGCGGSAAVAGHHSYPAILLPLLVAGAGIGLVVPAVTAAMLSAAGPTQAGIAAGAFNTLRQVGGLVGVAVMGLLGGTGETLGSIQACLLAAAVALAAAGATSALRSR
ncbi:MFS transporter [Amycolatopsis pigmentata]|uniref:MFS transporter n=1 Tax=Amycolatopsis pigmentata TaxID=450801 RepID=A0ABW5FRW0_9PSEU